MPGDCGVPVMSVYHIVVEHGECWAATWKTGNEGSRLTQLQLNLNSLDGVFP